MENADDHHPASTWRHEMVRCVQQATNDSDVSVAAWLRDGAPMGLAVQIDKSGLFPAVEEMTNMDLEELAGQTRWGVQPPVLF